MHTLTKESAVPEADKIRVDKLNELKNLFSSIAKTVVAIGNERELFKNICSSLIKIKDYNLVWISKLTSIEGGFEILAQSGLEGSDFIISVENCLKDKKIFTEAEDIKPPRTIEVKNYRFSESASSTYPLRKHWIIMSLPLIWENEATSTYLNISSIQKDYFSSEETELLNNIASSISIVAKSLRYEKEIIKKEERYNKILHEILDSFLIICERRDYYTSEHQKRVALLSSTIAKEMNLAESQIECIYLASLIHDIGKISIPLSILSKTSKLSKAELMIVHNHSKEGFEILEGIEFPWPIAKIILQHHERINGAGYPFGLTAKDIMLEAKILAVADVVEAISAHRPYRPAKGLKGAIAEITINKGKLYDATVVDAFLLALGKEKNSFLKKLF